MEGVFKIGGKIIGYRGKKTGLTEENVFIVTYIMWKYILNVKMCFTILYCVKIYI